MVQLAIFITVTYTDGEITYCRIANVESAPHPGGNIFLKEEHEYGDYKVEKVSPVEDDATEVVLSPDFDGEDFRLHSSELTKNSESPCCEHLFDESDGWHISERNTYWCPRRRTWTKAEYCGFHPLT